MPEDTDLAKSSLASFWDALQMHAWERQPAGVFASWLGDGTDQPQRRLGDVPARPPVPS